ncbi:MAG TPA: MlaD family protein [Gemmatimonadales bacterium]|nr:MlaD family protein [Gemmatimonadales bacterium]
MDLHYQKEVTVGTMVLVGIGLFWAGTLWLKGASFRSPARTEVVEFSDIGSLQPDNEVRVSGYAVGKVRDVTFKGPGRLLVRITLPPDLELKTDATAEVVSSVFASGATLSLKPGSPGAPPLPAGQPIRGVTGTDLFAKGAGLADRADSVLIGVQAIANQKTADNLQKTLQALQQVLTTMNQHIPQTTVEAQRTLVALRHLSERLDSTVATIPVGNAIERADTLARNLSTMSVQLTATGARLDTLLQKINSGQGTMGKFVNDSGLYYDARATSQSLKALIDELAKHPGKIQVQVKLF